MTWADAKKRKDNPYFPRLDDYENERWRALCTLKNEQPNSLAREAMLTYLEHCEKEAAKAHDATVAKRKQDAQSMKISSY